ncbi:DUF4166 domain-containing protein [Microbacterium abyssi]|uniref:DUF4166 domain-containing protein n=1 Tax=Microbacterium abyssi TaxID=2782166 RepID=UPI001E5C9CD2|nr:DUF4166 domain-containing protein [Microbacterium sp. A18JL241]
MNDLHPRLREYFSPLPDGHVGIGEGTFRRVGTPRRWLWPLLRPLHECGVVYAGWQLSVPFRVTNRLVAGRAVSEREFLLPGQQWIMRDAVSLNPHGRVVDELGEPGVVAASFDVEVDAGALSMTSHAIGIRWGRLRLRLPRLVSPVVRLTEAFDDEVGRQRVSVVIDMPLLGRIYEYVGDFSYRIEEQRA